MKPFGPKSISIGLFVATLLSIRGRRKKSLSDSGAITAFIVGFLSISCGNRGFLLLFFYQLGTMVTKFQCQQKWKKDGDASKSSVRSPYQVLACSGIAVVVSLIHAIYYGEEVSIGECFCSIHSHSSFCLKIYIFLYYSGEVTILIQYSHLLV